MLNFWEFLWFLCGAATVYFLVKDLLDKGDSINAQDTLILMMAFVGGPVSLIYLVTTEGDKIIIFKKKDKLTSQPEPLAPSQPQAPSSVYSKKPTGSVLDE